MGKVIGVSLLAPSNPFASRDIKLEVLQALGVRFLTACYGGTPHMSKETLGLFLKEYAPLSESYLNGTYRLIQDGEATMFAGVKIIVDSNLDTGYVTFVKEDVQ